MAAETAALPTPFVDVTADDLRWALALPARAPLASATHDFGAWRVELRVLGASHQVLVRDALTATTCSETVACDLREGAPLPALARRGLRGASYELRCRIAAAPAFGVAVDRIVAGVAELPAGLVGRFPGDSCAVTALAVETDGEALVWRTWHAYPQTSEIVSTASRLERVQP